MAKGRSFHDIRGGIDLSDKMVSTQWKGMQVVRSYAIEQYDARTSNQVECRRSLSSFSILWSSTLNDVERAEWEALAKMLGSAYHQEKRMTTNRSGSIICNNPGGVLMSGYDLFIRCNMLAKTSGFTYPRLKAPLPSGPPPSPGILAYSAMLADGRQGILCRLKPPLLSNTPHDFVYRIWMVVELRGRGIFRRMVAIVKPGSGLPSLEGVTLRERTLFNQTGLTLSHQQRQVLDAYAAEKERHTDGVIFTGFPMNKKRWGTDWISFSELDLGVVKLQAEVVIADTAEHGALRSAPSNMEIVRLPEQPDNVEAQRLLSIVRRYRREKARRQHIQKGIVKRFFLEAARKVLNGETTVDEVVDKTTNG